MTLLPIIPLSANDGQLVSLAALRGALDAKAIPLDPGTIVQNVIVSLSAQQISLSIAASLGLGTIFTGSVKANELGFWLDAIAFADSPISADASNIVKQTRWGYGIRIIFRVQQLDASFKLTFGTLGAAVQLDLATASYEVQTLGLGPQALVTVLGGLSQFGALTGDTIRDLNTKVLKGLGNLIANPPAGTNFVARPLAVQVNIPPQFDPIVKARSEVFAMRRIREGTDLTDALTRAGAEYSADAINAVYQQVVGNQPANQPPPQSAVAFAKTWMG